MRPPNASLQDNYVYENPRSDKFNSQSIRIDHTLTSKQRLFGRYTRNNRRESRNAQLGTVNGIVPNGNFLFRKNDGITLDHTYVQSAASLWDIRGGWQRFLEPNIRQHEGLFDPASLGWSSPVVGLFGGAQYFPHFDFDTIHDIGDNLAGNTMHSIYSFQPTYTRIMGGHSVHAGYDLRLYHEFGANPNRQAGEYTEQPQHRFTRQMDNSAAQNFLDVAGFLLGLSDRRHDRHQRDATERHLVSGGLRAGRLEAVQSAHGQSRPALRLRGSDDRQREPQRARLRSGGELSITSAAEAAYAARPGLDSRIAVARARRRPFASDSTPGFWNARRNNLQPRAGFAYKLTDKTVLRGGTGIYVVPFIIAGINQMGYSQSTPFTATQDRGLTFQSTLNNPYPLGTLQPVGNSLGPNTFLGQRLTRWVPLDLQNSQLLRYQLRCSENCRVSGCSRPGTSAATDTTSRQTSS